MKTSLPPTIRTPPPQVPNVIVSFPAPHVLLVTLNRPKQLNAIPSTQHGPLAALFEWYDEEPHLRCAVVTGEGRAFCAGADLREWDSLNGDNGDSGNGNGNPDSGAKGESERMGMASGAGFGGLSNRVGKKVVVAAVNGLCFGGEFFFFSFSLPLSFLFFSFSVFCFPSSLSFLSLWRIDKLRFFLFPLFFIVCLVQVQVVWLLLSTRDCYLFR